MDHKPFHPENDLKRMWSAINVWMLAFSLLAAAVLYVLTGVALLSVLALAAYILLIFLPVAIYIPAFFRTLEYTLEDDSILLKKGVFWRRRTTVPYTKITNIDITQGPVERVYKISTLHLQTAGSSTGESGKAEVVIPGIRDCEPLKEHIAQHTRAASASPAPQAMPAHKDTLGDILAELRALREDLRQKKD